MSFRDTKTPTKPTAKAKWQVPMRPHPTQGAPEYYMEGELKDKFCQLFPKNSNRRLMLWFGISFSTLHRFKNKFGLEKDMRAIRKQHAKDVKKTCEKEETGKRLSSDEAAQGEQSAAVQAAAEEAVGTPQGAVSQGAAAAGLRTNP